GESKWEAEAALCRIAGDSGLELVVIRPPLVYGPGGGRNYLALLQAVERGLPLPFASVNNRRSMIFVENLAHVICLCATVPHAAGQIYLVSDNEDLSTPELLRRMGRALGRPVRLFPVPVPLLRLAGKLVGRQDMMERLVGSLAVDISAVKDELGWSPPYTQEQGLRATVGHYYGRDEASDG
ncbi:MAG TPA: hypothetical protein ENJ19_12265, partial [Gammaproteobacteria bacterium]|nr:hypothetical protein [Gammaproteobacteria bacterium]